MSEINRSTPNLGLTVHFFLLVASILTVLAASGDNVLPPNLVYIPVNGILVAYSVLFALYFKNKLRRVALVSLVVSATSWFAAEMIWSVEELILNTDPYPSTADVFYILGYPFLLFFIYSVGRGMAASTPIKIISAAIALTFLIPTMSAATVTYDINQYEFILAASYTVFDALLIWVTLINLLNAGGKIKFWQFLFTSMVLLTIADSFFIVLELTGEYYVGHPIELFFLGSYIVLSFALFYQIRLAKSVKYADILEIFSTRNNRPNIAYTIVLVSSSIVVVIVISMMVLLGFDRLTTNEANSFIGITVSSIAITTILAVLTYVLGKKLTKLKTLEHQYFAATPQVKDEQSFQFAAIQERIIALERINKKTHTYALIGVMAMMVIGAMYFSENIFDFSSQHTVLRSGQYLVEDVSSNVVNTQAIWKINPAEMIQVDIVNAHMLPSGKLDAIKSAILSEETLGIPNSEIGKVPEDVPGTYHLGWKGALVSASTSKTSFPIPVDFQIFESDKAMGDITIILSDDRQPDGAASLTHLIVDEQERQILKAYITIFDVKNLDNHDFEDVVRHEFAHALGLRHESQMNLNLHDGHAYITECNIEHIVDSYNGIEPHAVCD
jgi:hypothetical protein